MRKKIFFVITIFVLIFSAVGCGGNDANTPDNNAADNNNAMNNNMADNNTAMNNNMANNNTADDDDAPVEDVTLTVWFLSGSPEEIALMQEMADQFAADHPGVTIDFSSYGFEDMNSTLRLALDGGTGPDVAYASPGPSHGVAYAKAGHLLNLSPSAKEYGWIDKFPQSVLTYTNDSLDEIYMAPFDMVTVGVYYNEEIFSELGLTPPETFEDFENVLATIKDAGYIPIAVGGLDGWPLAHVWDQLLHVIAPFEKIQAVEDGDTNASYADPDFVKAAEILNSWIEAGYFQDDMIATAYPDGNNLFITGQAAINIGGTWNNGTFSTQPEFPVRFFPMPLINQEIDWRMGGYSPNNAWMVPVYSENQELALEYVNYMMGPEVATAKWNAGDIVGYGFDIIPDPVSPLQADVYAAMQNTGTGYYMGNFNSEVLDAIWTNLQGMANGDFGPEEAMQNIQAVYESVVSE